MCNILPPPSSRNQATPRALARTVQKLVKLTFLSEFRVFERLSRREWGKNYHSCGKEIAVFRQRLTHFASMPTLLGDESLSPQTLIFSCEAVVQFLEQELQIIGFRKKPCLALEIFLDVVNSALELFDDIELSVNHGTGIIFFSHGTALLSRKRSSSPLNKRISQLG
jgi:hypothetical protein